ncbi:Arc family DNA-binding protein [Mesorhizobium sp.]|uniref:Arc family DNA-binding protein n=1 Tax=Mesorhizobium sp. TaxID=1871066 RepID=UPI0012148CC7|nr:Arc family DNA-binding protein [Mesorhizobium sp.]TIQ05717.1 MAG: Arc family DNA-binding protein [Mesorhizobium sp.]
MAKPGRGSDQFPLRLPPGMRDQIKHAAEESGRSMNSEILDVLRGAFPEEPSLEELVDALDHSVALLRDIRAQSTSGDVTRSNKYLNVLGRLMEANDQLLQVINDEDRASPVIVLRADVRDGLRKFQDEWEMGRNFTESLANDLIQMSLNRLASGEEKTLKAWIGEGDAKRMIEIEKHPSKKGSDQ